MPRVDHERLRAAARTLLEGLGTPADAADRVAESLVGADLCGHGSHGTIRLPTMYAEMVADGLIDPGATPAVTTDAGPTARVDGNRAFGQMTGRVAVETGAERAAEHGVAAVGVRNGTHLGRIGEWAARAAEAGLAFVAFVNTGCATRTVTVPGSAERVLSTNPVAVGVPTFGALPFPVVVDVATSQVAHGKVTKRAVDGDPVPAAWTVDADGKPVTDAEAFEEGAGALLPLGGRATGHKGFGLAVAAELLAGVVGGGEVFGEGDPGAVNNAACFLLVDPLAFTDRGTAADRGGALAEYLRAVDPAEAVETPAAVDGALVLPGEAELRTARRRRAEGVPVSEARLDALRGLAADLGVGRLDL